MPLDITVYGDYRFGLGVIKIMKIDRMITDARSDRKLRILKRLAVLFCVDR
jgi:hypothetical protein